MQNMAEPNPETNQGETSRTWERNSTRQAILDAARRLAAREGAESITLSRVAAEAGFAPPAVYAYFVSKDDLHLAVVADDLEKLARAMRGEEAEAETPPSEDGDAEEVLAADVIAFTPPAREAEEVELPFGDDAQADGEALAVSEDDTDLAETDTANAEDDAGEDEEGDEASPAAEPAVDGAALEVSLAEIEQALGVVIAENDFADEVVDEDVPDAFPEDSGQDSAEAAPEVADEAVSAARAAADTDTDAEPKGLRARFRRNRRAEDGGQMAMPLAPASAAAETPADMAQMAARITELQETVARLEARPVDSWLERRLRVFERTLADIEGRMEKTERDSMAALSTVSEGFKALDGRLAGTIEESERRTAESEQRQRAAAADLRQYVKDLAGRLGAVEAGLSRTLGESVDHFSRREDATGPVPEAVLEPAAEPEVADDAPAEPLKDGADYLSAARNAARAAAAKGEIPGGRSALSYLPIEPAAAKRIFQSRRTLQLVAGVLVLIVALIAASMMLHSKTTRSPAPAPQAAAPKIVESPDARVAALAKAGNAKAELVAALKLLNGDGVATDVPSAAYWLRKAADQNEPLAQYWLGTLYERGRGVAHDRAKAMQWYEKAAAAGNVKAMYRLGVGEAEGWNGEPNYAAAAKWFGKAANFGVIDAQYNLAVLYERGEGVAPDMTAAFKWYAIASAQGDAQSKERIDALAAEMQTKAVATAQAEAAAFKPKQPAPDTNVEPTVSEVAGSH